VIPKIKIRGNNEILNVKFIGPNEVLYGILAPPPTLYGVQNLGIFHVFKNVYYG